MKVHRAIVVTLILALTWVSYFKAYHQVFYVMGKTLSGELSLQRQVLLVLNFNMSAFMTF